MTNGRKPKDWNIRDADQGRVVLAYLYGLYIDARELTRTVTVLLILSVLANVAFIIGAFM